MGNRLLPIDNLFSGPYIFSYMVAFDPATFKSHECSHRVDHGVTTSTQGPRVCSARMYLWRRSTDVQATSSGRRKSES